MLDSHYFNTDIITQVNELGSGSCSLEVHLHSGRVFKVKSVGAVREGYILLEVYPEEGVSEITKAARQKAGGTVEVFYDRIAVPYEYIAYVYLTVTASDHKPPYGFSPASPKA
jgi:hypothetical protein